MCASSDSPGRIINIYGIDPASRSLGVVAWCHNKEVVVDKIVVAKGNRDLELKHLKTSLDIVFNRCEPEVIFVEEPVVAGVRNLRSTILIAQTVGMVLTSPAQVYLVPVSSWKKVTVGKGNAKKEEVASWLVNNHPDYAELCGNDQDLVDAGAINIYGRQILGSLGSVRVQRERDW